MTLASGSEYCRLRVGVQQNWPAVFQFAVLALLLTIAIDANARSLVFHPCPQAGSGGAQVLQAECAVLEVPLDPASPDGGTIELAVTRLPGSARPPLKDALIAINGGPGGSSRALLVDLGQALEAVAGERDILVVDQRGTGGSARLKCDNADQTVVVPSTAVTQSLTRDCLAALPHDPRFFTTSVAVNDLELLRDALGLETWTMYGVSYGTRVALHYTRRHPERVRALIVDGVVPTGLILGANVLHNSEAAFNALDSRCQNDARCSAAFGKLRPKLDQLMAQLKDPQRVELPHPTTGESTSIPLSYGHIAATVRLLLYAPETMATLPVMIDEAVTGRFLPFAAQSILALEKVTESIADGMHNAVVCTEDVPFFGAAEADRSSLAGTYLGPNMIETLATVCAIWPKGELDNDLHVPFQSTVPALIISGELDPITPPAYGDRLLKQFSKGQHLVAKGQGHGVLTRGCMPRLAAEFVANPSNQSIDARCLDRSPPAPIFLNSLGPLP
jgi:pimeloyl-ACP methyl ester carboxylesterase